ncbi:beta-1,4-galactosyltransferase galt-1-like isoform X6 [Tachysurus fulvidraco]|uniref:beta-1,4-galactosyltransferase galt-1-like isoform X6 n=1 Tax=Tachysurus fulvidraco TaxID=1234273 RepID=UPI001FEF4A67|nr:beta-1,4-galactosyltransferase galt-1-like isoform X6 [Tachysurus fulvidraco]
MNKQTADLRSRISRQFVAPKTLFILIVIVVLIFVRYFLTGLKPVKYRKPDYYPHWKKSNLLACEGKVKNDPIIKVTNLKTYMVGSYVEHRQEVKRIRTIAIVLLSENAEYQCMLCCNGKNVSVSASLNIHSDHYGFEYGTADIICQIPEECPTPTHVAITPKSPKENGLLQDIHAFQPVRNQQKQEVFPYEFTVCISAMYDYENVLLLVQAMEMFRILGVQKVAIYKTNCSKDTQKVLDYYVSQNFVELIPWSVSSYINVSRGWKKQVSPGELHYFGQIAALNDCLYRYMYKSHYVALQDLDEFILPLNFNNWAELLPELERKYGQEVGFEFENNFFPIYLKDPKSKKYSPDSWKKVPGQNILEYVYKLINDPSKFNNFKVIVNPRLVFETTVHGLLKSMKGTVRVNPEVARMYHIKNFKKEDALTNKIILDTHLRDYADRLIPAVSEVLHIVLKLPKV